MSTIELKKSAFFRKSDNAYAAYMTPNLSVLSHDEDLFIYEILQIKKVTKVVKGGKILTYKCLLIGGDLNGKIGIGVGRSTDMNLAMEKAAVNCKKHVILVPITPRLSIFETVFSTYKGVSVLLKPATLGTGLIAGSCTYTILRLAGLKNAISKQYNSGNLYLNTKATFLALSSFENKKWISRYRKIKFLTS